MITGIDNLVVNNGGTTTRSAWARAQMFPAQQSCASRASFPQVPATARTRTRLTDLLFWFFFVTDVFAACYWPISRLGELVAPLRILPLNTLGGLALLFSALLTGVVVRATVLLLKRRG
ncbi:MAG: hypothetical protein C5B50_22355 [Verrucomicrobia bacterium]|nr:MAG: hypothetical protein C5B50_22355 [Verrucomicrobiota bacterium]